MRFMIAAIALILSFSPASPQKNTGIVGAWNSVGTVGPITLLIFSNSGRFSAGFRYDEIHSSSASGTYNYASDLLQLNIEKVNGDIFTTQLGRKKLSKGNKLFCNAKKIGNNFVITQCRARVNNGWGAQDFDGLYEFEKNIIPKD